MVLGDDMNMIKLKINERIRILEIGNDMEIHIVKSYWTCFEMNRSEL